MSGFITFKAIRRLNACRKPIVVAGILAMIMGIFFGCEEAYTPGLNESVKASAPTSTEIAALSEEIKQSVKELEYSDKVAEDFVNMVVSWKDDKGQPVLVVWQKRLSKAKEVHDPAKISKAQLATIEESIVKELAQRIRHKEIRGNDTLFDLADVIENRQANCLGQSKLFWILGNSVGLSVKPINVIELMTPELMPPEAGHTACLVNLANGQTVMVDLAAWRTLTSKSFKFDNKFTKVGNYWEIRDKDNPLKIHRSIRMLDRNALVACIYTNRGADYADLGQFSLAISAYNKAIELNPKDAEPYYNRGNAYRKLHQNSMAVSDYTKAIKLNPKSVVAYDNRGVAYVALGHPNKAISDYNKALEFNPQDAVAYLNRGRAYSDLAQLNKALSDYTKAIEVDPKLCEAYNNRGNAYIRLGELSKAIADFNKAIELDPKHAEAYTNRGCAYVELGQPTKALSDFDKAIELDPELAEAYSNRGNTYSKLGQYNRAITDCTKAIEVNPKNADAYFNRGVAYTYLRQKTKAIQNYTKALELDPENVEAYYNRGVVYTGLENTKALSDFTKTLELHPRHADALFGRGVVYASLGQREEAKKDLLKAVELNPGYKSQVRKIFDALKIDFKLD